MAVLKQFYLKTRPWGIWRPVLAELRKENPEICANKDLYRDLSNIIVGLAWHTSLTAAPIFLVIQHWAAFSAAMAVVLLTSAILKFNWWDKLKDEPLESYQSQSEKAPLSAR